MAPEVDQSKSKALSQASDVWSFALVLVEWLAPQVWVKDCLDEGWAEKFNRRKRAGKHNVTGTILSSSSPHGLEHIWPWMTRALSIDLRQRPTMKGLCNRFKE
jgi:serine/threonine protein kinase